MDKEVKCPLCGSRYMKRTVAWYVYRGIGNTVGYGTAYVAQIGVSMIPVIGKNLHIAGKVAKKVSGIVNIEYKCNSCDNIFYIKGEE